MAEFDFKAKTLPTVTVGLLHASIAILTELRALKGDGPWLDELHDTLVRRLKNQVFEGLSPHEEIEQVDAALMAIDALFSAVDPRYLRSIMIDRRGARQQDR